MKKIIVKSLSFSTVKQYTEMCPEAVFYDKVEHLPREDGVSANLLFGSAIHTVSEAWYRGLFLNHEFDFDVLFRVFTSCWNQTPEKDVQYGAKSKEAMFSMAEVMIKLLMQDERLYQLLGVETPIIYKLTDSLTIVGKADLVYRDKEGILNIVDIKTAAKKYGPSEIHAVTSQTSVYGWPYNEPVKLGVKLFVKTKAPSLINIELTDPIDEDEVKNKFIQTQKGIQLGIRYKVRSWWCNGCQFAYHCNRNVNQQPNERRLAA
ncbi:MAG: PD-(D/E)XK nuclease family protein [Fibrobacteria bacterium]|nr:PD-(D/E)XK nuclease family protein [Fibrobacteria bacterium]